MKAMVKGMMLGKRMVAATLSLNGREEGSSARHQLAAREGLGCGRTVVGDICGCKATEQGERLAVEAAVVQDGEPLLGRKRRRGLHHSRHSIERETGVLTYSRVISHALHT